jgi:crotonobetainyl-CoA:carnitine CoA-transferase CaiB-like acyl-CoA transferase
MRPLAGTTAQITGDGSARAYAARLLDALGASTSGGVVGADLRVEPGRDDDPLVEWARCGGMWLTGEAGGAPQPAPGHQAASLRGAAAIAAALASHLGARVELDGPALVGERAALLGFSRRGTISPSGASRLLRSADRWVAVTLARAADVDLLAAWLGQEWHGDPWNEVAGALQQTSADEAVARAQLLGIPAAVAVSPSEVRAAPFRVERSRRSRARRWPPMVVDLSSLWAGPLCTRLLRDAGARVIKVESVRRPDGTRSGPPAFFDLMHAGKESVALDFGTDAGHVSLAALVAAADVVVESSRPRALEQLGVDAQNHDGVWVSITGYGRNGPWRDRVAFGDDAAVAGGISALTGEPDGPPLFCADAYADPVAGLLAAIAALACLVPGGGWMIDVAMRDVVAHLLADAPSTRVGTAGRVVRSAEGWTVVTSDGPVAVTPPPAPARRGKGPGLGQHTRTVLAELGIDR